MNWIVGIFQKYIVKKLWSLVVDYIIAAWKNYSRSKAQDKARKKYEDAVIEYNEVPDDQPELKEEKKKARRDAFEDMFNTNK